MRLRFVLALFATLTATALLGWGTTLITADLMPVNGTINTVPVEVAVGLGRGIGTLSIASLNGGSWRNITTNSRFYPSAYTFGNSDTPVVSTSIVLASLNDTDNFTTNFKSVGDPQNVELADEPSSVPVPALITFLAIGLAGQALMRRYRHEP